MALYSEKVMDHFRNPRNVGQIDDADGVGEVGNAKCGDIMRMYIKVDDGIITDVKFNTFGCASAIATSSMATELIKGKPVEEALKLSNDAVVEALDGLPTHKIHCSVLAEEAVSPMIRRSSKSTRTTRAKAAASECRPQPGKQLPGSPARQDLPLRGRETCSPAPGFLRRAFSVLSPAQGIFAL